jgi:hypothetical protein
MHKKILVSKPEGKGRNFFEYVATDGRIILKLILEK